MSGLLSAKPDIRAASIGLINVYQRLSALFEDDVSILITRRFNTTIVKISVPNEVYGEL